jgi:hypothetical protein
MCMCTANLTEITTVVLQYFEVRTEGEKTFAFAMSQLIVRNINYCYVLRSMSEEDRIQVKLGRR